MQIFANFLRVIFMLSTIVVITDCCSSRILLLKEHTLRIVYQHRSQYQDHYSSHMKSTAHVKLPEQLPHRVTDVDFSKSHNSDYSSSTSTAKFNESEEDETSTTDTTFVDDYSTTVGTVGSVEENPVANAKYHVIDLYYTIMRDVLSLECSGPYLTDFCLNGGRCFRYPVGNHSFFSCECADGYMGERCESKSLNDLYMPTTMSHIGTKQPKIRMARFVFSFPMLIAISVIYLFFGAIVVFKCPQHKHRNAGMFDG